MHIRRGDFHDQFADSISDAEFLVQSSEHILEKQGSKTLYIATDEMNTTYFTPFNDKYQLFFLGDFMHLLEDVNSSYYPFLDQLISARGEVFFGTQSSTFTAYINRVRGYYSWRDKLEMHEGGGIKSYYFSPEEWKKLHEKYFAIEPPVWAYEFPEGWYDIDKDIENFKE